MSRQEKELTEPVATESGEKFLKGSVRPDGTVRKDRRIRAGYTPQEEQPVYQSRGTVIKQNVPKCPGLDDDEIEEIKKQQQGQGKKSGVASKARGTPAAAASAPPSKPAAAAPKAPAAGPSQQAAPQPAQEQPSGEIDIEKQIRALRKKVRQCEELAEKKKQGGAVDKDQEEKIAKAAIWQQEISDLEAQLERAKLG